MVPPNFVGLLEAEHGGEGGEHGDEEELGGYRQPSKQENTFTPRSGLFHSGLNHACNNINTPQLRISYTVSQDFLHLFFSETLLSNSTGK